MANNSVGTSRFYVNCIEWMHSLGQVSSAYSLGINRYFTTSASNPTYHGLEDGYNDTMSLPKFGDIPYNAIMGDKAFIALLGHNLKSADCKMLFQEGHPNYNVIGDVEGIVNWGEGRVLAKPSYDGFSIATCNMSQWDQTGNPNNIRFESGGWTDVDDNWNPTTQTGSYGGLDGVTIGAIVIGNFYEMSHSADLSLTLGYETGTKTIETRGGASLSNTFWRPPMWGSTLGAWELSAPDSTTTGQKLAHSSRRTWNLSFSFLDKTDSFPKYNALNRYTNENLSDNELLLTEGETLSDSNDFFSVVWEKVGTALPFIFQPDKDVPEFAIAKFSNNFSFQQTAPNLYSVKMKIREVW